MSVIGDPSATPGAQALALRPLSDNFPRYTFARLIQDQSAIMIHRPFQASPPGAGVRPTTQEQ
jgi:hypothetical protein